MKFIYIIIILFVSFRTLAEENTTYNPYKKVLNILGYPIKYCDKFIFTTNRVESNENKSGIIIATNSIFNNNNYLKESFYQSHIPNAIFTIEPKNLDSCGTFIYADDQFYIKFLNTSYSNKNYLKNDGAGHYILEEKNIFHKDSENYLFSLRSTDNFIHPENYSYILNQRINNRFSVLHCNQSDWCHTKNNFDNLILKLTLVLERVHEKAKVPFD
jgi:hypothetical protein